MHKLMVNDVMVMVASCKVESSRSSFFSSNLKCKLHSPQFTNTITKFLPWLHVATGYRTSKESNP